MSIKKTVNKGLGFADKTLRFIQQNFNVTDNFADIIALLQYQATVIKDIQAQKLVDKKEDTKIIQGNNLMAEFENITSQFDLNGKSATILRQTDKLIYDLNNAKGWLVEYENWVNRNKSASLNNQLLAIGKAILGRAIELCPIDTGYLRKSGTIIQSNNSVIIGFYAPYAIYVHESLEAYHKVGQAKFLENAVQQILPNSYTWVDMLDKGTVAVKITLGR